MADAWWCGGARRMYQTRAANCCAEYRAILGCDATGPLTDCPRLAGFQSTCADIPAQFGDVAGSGFDDGYACHQFPARLRGRPLDPPGA